MAGQCDTDENIVTNYLASLNLVKDELLLLNVLMLLMLIN